jgi:hypothetical protein
MFNGILVFQALCSPRALYLLPFPAVPFLIQRQPKVLYPIFHKTQRFNLYPIHNPSHYSQNQIPHSKMAPKSTKNAELRRSARLAAKPAVSYAPTSTCKPNNIARARKSKAAKVKNSKAKAAARKRVVHILGAVTERVAF